MDFFQLIDGAEILSCSGNAGIQGLDYDSRRIEPGFCFVAMRGGTTDGNQFIDQAIQKGAVAVVSDNFAFTGRNRIFVGEWIQRQMPQVLITNVGVLFHEFECTGFDRRAHRIKNFAKFIFLIQNLLSKSRVSQKFSIIKIEM